jgi:hypothetical protein
MSINGFSTLHDPEVQAYNRMRAAYKARVKEQKQQAKLARRELIESINAKHGSSSGSINFKFAVPGGVGVAQIARLQDSFLRREGERKEAQRGRRGEMGLGEVHGKFCISLEIGSVVDILC